MTRGRRKKGARTLQILVSVERHIVVIGRDNEGQGTEGRRGWGWEVGWMARRLEDGKGVTSYK
jgi:hypothetical protein